MFVDPLAEKYPGVGGYTYCFNNPIMFIDPDGREIIITSGKESYFYNPNQNYGGSNSYIKNNIEALNKAYTANLGKAVIDEAVGSKSTMTIKEGSTDFPNTFDFDISTFTMTSQEHQYFNIDIDAESIMHEVLHFYQSLFGEADKSIATELEAYIFQHALGLQLGEGSNNLTQMNPKGDLLSKIINDFVFDVSDSETLKNSFKEGVKLFKEGHGNGDIYKNFKLNEDKKPNRLLHFESEGILKFNL